ncbi:unnamed protein product [Phaedon cochleariae]|uniref:BACK domain-containing protein n=1 Tax=Phaedon cochleariae TaxID=80249 RepID=A0A9P0DRG7_PHACE|nr:unnamed protein product [Phaedon cochleariae]
MVLKVEDRFHEESKPILESNGLKGAEDNGLKVGDMYKPITSSKNPHPLTIDKPEVALDLFLTAVNVQDVPLANQCIESLKGCMCKRTALPILKGLAKCKVRSFDPYSTEPSAPPLKESDDGHNDDWVHDLIENLKNDCLLEIDKNADFALKQKEILEMDYCDILSITRRDTLQVSSEMIVYSAVMRWCIEECHRRTLQAQRINLKAVLRELAYAPRYGLMSKKEFLCRTVDGVKGPDRSGILDEQETERILEYIRRKSKNRPAEELPFKGSVPRKPASEKAKKFRSDSSCSSKSTCDKFILNFLTCWTAIFD